MIFDLNFLKKHYNKNTQKIKENNYINNFISSIFLDKLADFKNISQKKEILILNNEDNFFLEEIQNIFFNKANITITHFAKNFLINQKNNIKTINLDLDDLTKLTKSHYDLIIFYNNFHYHNNIEKILFDIKNLLNKDGLFLASFIGGKSLSNLRQACKKADDEMHSYTAKIAPMIDVKDAGRLLQKINFVLPVSDSDKLILEYKNIDDLLLSLKKMGCINILTKRHKGMMSKKRFSLIKKHYSNNNQLDLEIINLMGVKKK